MPLLPSLLLACADPTATSPTGTPPETDTDTAGDSAAHTGLGGDTAAEAPTADTSVVADTGDSGGAAHSGSTVPTDTGDTAAPPPELLTPGCPVPFTPVPAELADCTAVETVTEGANHWWVATEHYEYDAQGRLVLETYSDTYGDVTYTRTYDPATGDVLQEVEDQNFGEFVTTRDYTWTRDGYGRVIQEDGVGVTAWLGSPGAPWSWQITFAWGPCGVERTTSSTSETTTGYYLEGTRDSADLGRDGVVDNLTEHLVDPATGFPVEYRYFAAGNPVPTTTSTDTRDPATGWLVAQHIDGTRSSSDHTFTYDADGRQLTHETVVVDRAYGYGYEHHATTVWTCPP